MRLSLEIKPFSFFLVRSLKTFRGIIHEKKGWLLKIENESGDCGWGEVAPMDPFEIEKCGKILKSLGVCPSRELLEEIITSSPGPLGFGIGSALGELDYLIGSERDNNWLKAPKSAFLLSTAPSCLEQLEVFLETIKNNPPKKITIKLKVGMETDLLDNKLIHDVLKRLPNNCCIRLDANTGWSREQANHWANYFLNDHRLEWLEQPLPTNDLQGLLDLSQKVPVALDESLIKNPSLTTSWKSWQIRRPALEGDPRILLEELLQGKSHIAISTFFETGIGRRWIDHLAALQQQSPTPTAPGLAPGWCPHSLLFSDNPRIVWETA